jgi:hypothetical protein
MQHVFSHSLPSVAEKYTEQVQVKFVLDKLAPGQVQLAPLSVSLCHCPILFTYSSWLHFCCTPKHVLSQNVLQPISKTVNVDQFLKLTIQQNYAMNEIELQDGSNMTGTNCD